MFDKYVLKNIAIGALVILVLIAVGEMAGIGFTRVFGVAKQDAKREVFEQTQSYTHGKIQQLSKYYSEYSGATAEEKQTIKIMIVTDFGDFNEKNITNNVLRNFLINMRGY